MQRKSSFFMTGSIMLAVLAVLPVFGQELPPIMKQNYRQGVYKDFNDFITNRPSIGSAFRIIPISSPNRIEKDKGKYKLELLDSNFRRRDVRKIWGFCDGQKLFINEHLYGGSVRFTRIQEVGRYIYFKGTPIVDPSMAVAVGMVGGAIGGAVVATVATYGEALYVININNGNIFTVDRKLLERILKQDEALYRLYQQDTTRLSNDRMIEYIQMFNEKHILDIAFNKPVQYDVTLYRRTKRELPDSLTISFDDSVIKIAPGTAHRLTTVRDSVEICIEESCEKILLQKKKQNYVKCFWHADLKKLEAVDPKVGEFDVRQIEFANTNR